MIGGMDAIRAEVMAEPEAERVQYALDLLEWYLNPAPDFYARAADLGLRLGAPDLRVLYALERERGRFVRPDRLIAARCFDRPLDAWQTLERVPQAIRSIKDELARIAAPAQIEALREVGYRLTAAPDWCLLTAPDPARAAA